MSRSGLHPDLDVSDLEDLAMLVEDLQSIDDAATILSVALAEMGDNDLVSDSERRRFTGYSVVVDDVAIRTRRIRGQRERDLKIARGEE